MTATVVPQPVADLVDATLEATIVGSFTCIGFDVRRVVDGWQDVAPGSLTGRTALVTGATSGLGLAAAKGLALAGADIVVLGRNPDRTAEVCDELRADAPEVEVSSVIADLSRMEDVRDAAEVLAERLDALDVVVHNAGTLVHELEVTEDGLEVTAQLHVAAPFLLTTLLLPLLVASPDPRVIQVVSGGLYTAQLSVDALNPSFHEDGDFDGVRAYARAKRAALALTEQWARRSAGTDLDGIRFHAMHPGWADTAGVHRSLPGFARVIGPLLRSPEQAVDTTVWLASADEPRRSNGQLWLDRRRRRRSYLPGTADPVGEDDRLWDWACAAAGIDPVAGAEARDRARLDGRAG